MNAFELILLFFYLYGCFSSLSMHLSLNRIFKAVGGKTIPWYFWITAFLGSWLTLKCCGNAFREMVENIIEDTKDTQDNVCK